METHEKEFTLIERYADGMMADSEREAFEQGLEAEPELKRMLNEYTLIKKTYIEASRRIELKQTIQAAIATNKTVRLNQRKMWLIAASVMLIAAIGTLIVFSTGTKKPDNQFTANSLPGEKAVEGKQNTMKEFGNMDVVKLNIPDNAFFPDEYTYLKANDTILFQWPSELSQRYLTIYNSRGELVMKATIKKNIKEYVLMPGVLKPGVYYWKFMNDSMLIRIRVNNN